MYGYYHRYRRHALNWLTPFARGFVHGIVFGGLGTMGIVLAAKYLL
jgi:hypothetical protein